MEEREETKKWTLEDVRNFKVPLSDEINALTDDPEERARLLTQSVVPNFLNFFVNDNKRRKRRKLIKLRKLRSLRGKSFDGDLIELAQVQNGIGVRKMGNVKFVCKAREERPESQTSDIKSDGSGWVRDEFKKRKHDQKGKREAKRVRKCQQPNDEGPITPIPQQVRDKFRELDCTEEPVFVIKKELTQTDLSRTHNRFSIAGGKANHGFFEFLTAEEEENLENQKEVRVKLLDPKLRVSDQILIKWVQTHQYALRTNWYKEVVAKNQNTLKKRDMVQVWVSRCGSEPIFAFVVA